MIQMDMVVILKNVHRNNAPSKTFQNICFWDKESERKTKIATYMDL